MRLFSKLYGKSVEARKLEQVFQLAVSENQTVQTLVSEIQSELSAMDEAKAKLSDAIRLVR